MAANGFNLTAQINLRGPSNIGVVVADIKKQIGSINANLNVTISANAAKNVTQLNNGLQALNQTFKNVQASATSAATAIAQFNAAVGNTKISSYQNNINSSITATQKLGQSQAQTAKAISTSSSEMEEFGKQAGLAVRRFAAFSAVTSVIFGVTNSVSKGISAFIDFDKELVRLQQVTGESASGLSFLQNTITSLSTNLGVGSAELLNVSSTLAQAGLSARDTEKALKALALSSLAPSFDSMNETVEGSIALMRQFGIGAGDLTKALGSVNAVAAKFAVEASDIISAIQRTGGVFASASKGVSEGTQALNEFVAVFTSVRATTRESAETIATGLRTIFTRVQREGTIDALKEYGVNLTDLNGKFVGAYKAVELLSKGLNSIDPRDLKFSRIVEELGGFRQIGKVIPLIQEFGTAQQALSVAQSGQNSLTTDAVKAQLSLANQISKVREEFLALFREIGASNTFQNMATGALQVVRAIVKVADAVKGVLPVLAVLGISKGLDSLIKFGSGLYTGIRKGPDNKSGGFAQGGPVRYFATGGLVPGSGNSDSVNARLTPGEFVMRKSAVSSIGADNLRTMNQGGLAAAQQSQVKRINKYAGGNIVTQIGGVPATTTVIKGKDNTNVGFENDFYNINADKKIIKIVYNKKDKKFRADRKLIDVSDVNNLIYNNPKSFETWENIAAQVLGATRLNEQDPNYPIDLIKGKKLYDAKFRPESGFKERDAALKALSHRLEQTDSGFKYNQSNKTIKLSKFLGKTTRPERDDFQDPGSITYVYPEFKDIPTNLKSIEEGMRIRRSQAENLPDEGAGYFARKAVSAIGDSKYISGNKNIINLISMPKKNKSDGGIIQKFGIGGSPDAISTYKASSMKLNRSLMLGTPLTKEEQKNVKDLKKQTTDKLPKQLYSGIGENRLNIIKNQVGDKWQESKGKTFSLPGFLSTSSDSSIAIEFARQGLLTILTNSKRKGIDTNKRVNTDYDLEKEFILPPNSKFKVLKTEQSQSAVRPGSSLMKEKVNLDVQQLASGGMIQKFDIGGEAKAIRRIGIIDSDVLRQTVNADKVAEGMKLIGSESIKDYTIQLAKLGVQKRKSGDLKKFRVIAGAAGSGKSSLATGVSANDNATLRQTIRSHIITPQDLDNVDEVLTITANVSDAKLEAYLRDADRTYTISSDTKAEQNLVADNKDSRDITGKLLYDREPGRTKGVSTDFGIEQATLMDELGSKNVVLGRKEDAQGNLTNRFRRKRGDELPEIVQAEGFYTGGFSPPTRGHRGAFDTLLENVMAKNPNATIEDILVSVAPNVAMVEGKEGLAHAARYGIFDADFRSLLADINFKGAMISSDTQPTGGILPKVMEVPSKNNRRKFARLKGAMAITSGKEQGALGKYDRAGIEVTDIPRIEDISATTVRELLFSQNYAELDKIVNPEIGAILKGNQPQLKNRSVMVPVLLEEINKIAEINKILANQKADDILANAPGGPYTNITKKLKAEHPEIAAQVKAIRDDRDAFKKSASGAKSHSIIRQLASTYPEIYGIDPSRRSATTAATISAEDARSHIGDRVKSLLPEGTEAPESSLLESIKQNVTKQLAAPKGSGTLPTDSKTITRAFLNLPIPSDPTFGIFAGKTIDPGIVKKVWRQTYPGLSEDKTAGYIAVKEWLETQYNARTGAKTEELSQAIQESKMVGLVGMLPIGHERLSGPFTWMLGKNAAGEDVSVTASILERGLGKKYEEEIKAAQRHAEQGSELLASGLASKTKTGPVSLRSLTKDQLETLGQGNIEGAYIEQALARLWANLDNVSTRTRPIDYPDGLGESAELFPGISPTMPTEVKRTINSDSRSDAIEEFQRYFRLINGVPEPKQLKEAKTQKEVVKALAEGGEVQNFMAGGVADEARKPKAAKTKKPKEVFGTGETTFPSRISKKYAEEEYSASERSRAKLAWDKNPKDERIMIDDEKVKESFQQPFDRERFASSFKEKISRDSLFARMSDFAKFVGLPQEDLATALPLQLDFGASKRGGGLGMFAAAEFSKGAAGVRPYEGYDLSKFGYGEKEKQEVYGLDKLITAKEKEIKKIRKTPTETFDDGSFSFDSDAFQKAYIELDSLKNRFFRLKDLKREAEKSALTEQNSVSSATGRGTVSFAPSMGYSSDTKNSTLYHEMTHQLFEGLRTRSAESFDKYRSRVSSLFSGDNDDLADAFDSLTAGGGYTSADVVYGRSYKSNNLSQVLSSYYRQNLDSSRGATPIPEDLTKNLAVLNTQSTAAKRAREYRPINPKVNEALLQSGEKFGITQEKINRMEDNGKEEFLTTLIEKAPQLDQNLQGILDSTLTELLAGAGIQRQKYAMGGMVRLSEGGSPDQAPKLIQRGGFKYNLEDIIKAGFTEEQFMKQIPVPGGYGEQWQIGGMGEGSIPMPPLLKPYKAPPSAIQDKFAGAQMAREDRIASALRKDGRIVRDYEGRTRDEKEWRKNRGYNLGGLIQKFGAGGRPSRGVDVDKEFMENPTQSPFKDKVISKKLGPEVYDLEKSSGLSRGQFQQAYEYAKMMDFTREEFEKDLARRRMLEEQKARIKTNPSDMAKQLMPQTKPLRPDLRALADSLRDKNNDIGYRPSALEVIAQARTDIKNARGLAIGGVAEPEQKKEKKYGKISITEDGTMINAGYFKDNTRSGYATAYKMRDNLYYVGLSSATSGYGPRLYDVLMEAATEKGAMLTSDRSMVSGDAKKVWEYYFNNRSDVKKTPLKPSEWTRNDSLIDPKLYGKEETWPPATDPAWILQSGYSKSPNLINGPDVVRPSTKPDSRAMALSYFSARTPKFASGGTVPALVSNGEAYVPPTVAKRIGYSTLNRMNQADRNGMSRFSDGGISVFKGPGTGTSDSIPVTLPVGSFIIREAATKALGFSSGGSVGIQKFATGGTATDYIISKKEEKETKTAELDTLKKQASTETGSAKVLLESKIKAVEKTLEDLDKEIETASKEFTDLSKTVDDASKAQKQRQDTLNAAQVNLVDKLKGYSFGGTKFEDLNDSQKQQVIEKAQKGDYTTSTGKDRFETENKAIRRAQGKLDTATRVKEEAETDKSAKFGDAKTTQDVKNRSLTSAELQDKRQQDDKFFEYKGRKEGTTTASYKYGLAKQLGQSAYQIQDKDQYAGRKQEMAYDLSTKRNKLSGLGNTLEQAKADVAATTAGTPEADAANTRLADATSRLDAEVEAIAKSMRDLNPTLENVDENARAVANALAAGDLDAAQKKMIESLGDVPEEAEAMKIAMQRMADQLGVDVGTLEREFGSGAGAKTLDRQKFIASREGQRFGVMAEMAPDLAKRFSESRAGKFGGNVSDFISGKGGAYSQAFAKMGGMTTLNMGIAAAPGLVQKAMGDPTSSQGAATYAGAQGAASTLGAGLQLAAKTGPFAPFVAAGAAVAALATAFKDGRNAFIEFEKNLRSQNIQRALEGTASGFEALGRDAKDLAAQRQVSEKLVTAGKEAEASTNIDQTVPKAFFVNLLDSMGIMGGGKDSVDRSKILEKEGTLAYLSSLDVFGGTSQRRAYTAAMIPEQAQTNAKQYSEIATQSKQLIEVKGRAGQTFSDVKASPEYASLAKNIALSNIAVQEQILAIDNSTSYRTAADREAAKEAIIRAHADKEISKMMLASDRARAAADLEKTSRSFTMSFKRLFENMEASVNRTNAELAKFNNALDSNVAAMTGSGKNSTNTELESLEVLKNPKAYSQERVDSANNKAGSIFGFDSQIVSGLSGLGEKLETSLLSSINSTISKNPGASDTKIVMDLEKSIGDQVSGLSLPKDLSKQLTKEIASAVGDLRKEGTKKIDIDQLTDRIPGLKNAIDSAKNAQNASVAALQNWQNNLNNYAEALNRSADMEMQAADLRRKANDIAIEGAMSLGQALGKNYGADIGTKLRDQKVGGMTGGLTSPTDIRNRMDDLNSQRQRQEAEVKLSKNESVGGNKNAIQNVINNENALKQTNVQLRQTGAALKVLAESGSAASAALNAIQEAQRKQQGKVGLIEKLVTSGPEELFNFNKSLTSLQRMSAGQVVPQTAEERRDTLSTLNDITPLLGDGKQANNIKANVLESMLKDSGVGVSTQFKEILNALRNPESDNETQQAIKVYQQAIDVQTQANEMLAQINSELANDIAKTTADAIKTALTGVTLNFNKEQLDDIAKGVRAPVTVAEPKALGGVIYAAAGTMVDFKPQGTDTVPAMLTPGEFVVNRTATANNLGLLHSINSGKTSYYADGGYVSNISKSDFGSSGTTVTDKEYPVLGTWNNTKMMIGYDNVQVMPFFQTKQSFPLSELANNSFSYKKGSSKEFSTDSYMLGAGQPISATTKTLRVSGGADNRLYSSSSGSPGSVRPVSMMTVVDADNAEADVLRQQSKEIEKNKIEAYQKRLEELESNLPSSFEVKDDFYNMGDGPIFYPTMQKAKQLSGNFKPKVTVTNTTAGGYTAQLQFDSLAHSLSDAKFGPFYGDIDKDVNQQSLPDYYIEGGIYKSLFASNVGETSSKMSSIRASLGVNPFALPITDQQDYVNRLFQIFDRVKTAKKNLLTDQAKSKSDKDIEAASFYAKLDKIYKGTIVSEVFKGDSIDLEPFTSEDALVVYSTSLDNWNNKYIKDIEDMTKHTDKFRDLEYFGKDPAKRAINITPEENGLLTGPTKEFAWIGGGDFEFAESAQKAMNAEVEQNKDKLGGVGSSKQNTGKILLQQPDVKLPYDLSYLEYTNSAGVGGSSSIAPNEKVYWVQPVESELSVFANLKEKASKLFIRDAGMKNNEPISQVRDLLNADPAVNKYFDSLKQYGIEDSRTKALETGINDKTVDIRADFLKPTAFGDFTSFREAYNGTISLRIGDYLRSSAKAISSKLNKDSKDQAKKKMKNSTNDAESLEDKQYPGASLAMILGAQSLFSSGGQFELPDILGNGWFHPTLDSQYKSIYDVDLGTLRAYMGNLSQVFDSKVQRINQVMSRIPDSYRDQAVAGLTNLYGATNAFKAISDGDTSSLMGLFGKADFQNQTPQGDPAMNRKAIELFQSLGMGVRMAGVGTEQFTKDQKRQRENELKGVKINNDGSSSNETKEISPEQLPKTYQELFNLAINPYNEFPNRDSRKGLIQEFISAVPTARDPGTNSLLFGPQTGAMFGTALTDLQSWYGGGRGGWLGSDYLTEQGTADVTDAASGEPKSYDTRLTELEAVKNDALYQDASAGYKHIGGKEKFNTDLPDFDYYKDKAPLYRQTGGMIYASQGTLVNFEPRGTDTVPAMLTPGEFVINRRATQEHLPLLEAINNGGIKGFSEGGVVYLAGGGMAQQQTKEERQAQFQQRKAAREEYLAQAKEQRQDEYRERKQQRDAIAAARREGFRARENALRQGYPVGEANMMAQQSMANSYQSSMEALASSTIDGVNYDPNLDGKISDTERNSADVTRSLRSLSMKDRRILGTISDPDKKEEMAKQLMSPDMYAIRERAMTQINNKKYETLKDRLKLKGEDSLSPQDVAFLARHEAKTKASEENIKAQLAMLTRDQELGKHLAQNGKAYIAKAGSMVKDLLDKALGRNTTPTTATAKNEAETTKETENASRVESRTSATVPVPVTPTPNQEASDTKKEKEATEQKEVKPAPATDSTTYRGPTPTAAGLQRERQRQLDLAYADRAEMRKEKLLETIAREGAWDVNAYDSAYRRLMKSGTPTKERWKTEDFRRAIEKELMDRDPTYSRRQWKDAAAPSTHYTQSPEYKDKQAKKEKDREVKGPYAPGLPGAIDKAADQVMTGVVLPITETVAGAATVLRSGSGPEMDKKLKENREALGADARLAEDEKRKLIGADQNIFGGNVGDKAQVAYMELPETEQKEYLRLRKRAQKGMGAKDYARLDYFQKSLGVPVQQREVIPRGYETDVEIPTKAKTDSTAAKMMDMRNQSLPLLGSSQYVESLPGAFEEGATLGTVLTKESSAYADRAKETAIGTGEVVTGTAKAAAGTTVGVIAHGASAITLPGSEGQAMLRAFGDSALETANLGLTQVQLGAARGVGKNIVDPALAMTYGESSPQSTFYATQQQAQQQQFDTTFQKQKEQAEDLAPGLGTSYERAENLSQTTYTAATMAAFEEIGFGLFTSKPNVRKFSTTENNKFAYNNRRVDNVLNGKPEYQGLSRSIVGEFPPKPPVTSPSAVQQPTTLMDIPTGGNGTRLVGTSPTGFNNPTKPSSWNGASQPPSGPTTTQLNELQTRNLMSNDQPFGAPIELPADLSPTFLSQPVPSSVTSTTGATTIPVPSPATPTTATAAKTATVPKVTTAAAKTPKTKTNARVAGKKVAAWLDSISSGEVTVGGVKLGGGKLSKETAEKVASYGQFIGDNVPLVRPVSRFLGSVLGTKKGLTTLATGAGLPAGYNYAFPNKEKTPQNKASGGIVYASNGALIEAKQFGSDSVPAMLTPGEFVVNRQSAQRFMPVLNAINSGHYAHGGVVKYLADGGIVQPKYLKDAGMVNNNITNMSSQSGVLTSTSANQSQPVMAKPAWVDEFASRLEQSGAVFNQGASRVVEGANTISSAGQDIANAQPTLTLGGNVNIGNANQVIEQSLAGMMPIAQSAGQMGREGARQDSKKQWMDRTGDA
jgi:TP901 family phage tail tape measure protein